MGYTRDRLLPDTSLEDGGRRVRNALKAQGFGVLTEIDVRKTMKQKLDAEMGGYLIFGVCNPKMAWGQSVWSHAALQSDLTQCRQRNVGQRN